MYKAKPWIMTSVKLSPEFYNLSKEHHVSFTEAMRVGISIILAERGIGEYDNSLNIVKRIKELKVKAAQYAQQAADLELTKEAQVIEREIE